MPEMGGVRVLHKLSNWLMGTLLEIKLVVMMMMMMTMTTIMLVGLHQEREG